ncbi:MAG: cell division protein FtsQ/DivIB [Alphaproteobacteria bacterium]|nr:cell division protein FtsQ/DivIB [Alphaproteobacteria bacterium]
MSAATIRRGGAANRKVKRKSTGRSMKRRSRVDRFLAGLPFSDATLHKMGTWAIMLLVAAALGGFSWFIGLPGMAQQEFSDLARRAGFEVRKVEVRGIERMDELPVYAIALGQHERSMPSVDLVKLRSDLMQLGWVQDARVSRRLPDTLIIDIVERKPVAVWQNKGKLSLIDVRGTVLQPVDLSAMPDLPLVVGPNANLNTAALNELMEAAPALKPMLAGATWVGNRRWDLRFQTGETLSLPEGSEQASAALVNFARMDGVNRLLGRGIMRFDMRDPDKFVLRLPKTQDAVAAKSKDEAVTPENLTDGEG